MNFDKPQIICHIEKSIGTTLFDVRWIPCSAKFVVLGSQPRGTGLISIFELSEGGLNTIKESEQPKSIRCGTFGATSFQDRQLATGNFEGQLEVWDLERLTPSVYSAKAHSQIVNAIDGVGGLCTGVGAPEIVTGSRDGSVKIWDIRQKEKPVALLEPKEGETRRDCWTVAFGNSFSSEERIVCAGYDNGDIKMFDLKTMTVRWETHVKNGVCFVQFDRKDTTMNKLIVTTIGSKFHVFDLRTQHPTKGFTSLTETAHKSTIWLGNHLPQNRDIFLTTGGGGTLCLWKYEYPGKRQKLDLDNKPVGVIGSLSLLQNCTLSSQPVGGFDWNRDKLGLAVCTSFDQTLRVLIVTKLNRYS